METTLGFIKSCRPCDAELGKMLAHKAGDADDIVVTYPEVLRVNGFSNALWLAQRDPEFLPFVHKFNMYTARLFTPFCNGSVTLRQLATMQDVPPEINALPEYQAAVQQRIDVFTQVVTTGVWPAGVSTT